MGLPYDTARCAKTDASYHCPLKRQCRRETDKGRAEFARAWPPMHEAFELMFEGIDDAEYAALVATLEKMLRNIRKHEI